MLQLFASMLRWAQLYSGTTSSLIGGYVRIIINSDDLGISTNTNDCIMSLIQQRRVTSATLIMNAPAIENAINRLGGHPECSFGVHLNVTKFSPISSHPGLRPLLDENGDFAGNIRKIPLTAEIRNGVFTEWCAQVEEALKFGIAVSHFDSHHQIHTDPRLFGVLKGVQRKFGIRRVRITRNVFGVAESISMQMRVAKSPLCQDE